jgi:hypothetical protein
LNNDPLFTCEAETVSGAEMRGGGNRTRTGQELESFAAENSTVLPICCLR